MTKNPGREAEAFLSTIGMNCLRYFGTSPGSDFIL